MTAAIRAILVSGTALTAFSSVLQTAYAQQATTAAQQEDEAALKKPRVTLLDRIVISATMINEAVIEALSATSTVDAEELDRVQATGVADVFRTVPGVAASMNGDDPATSINIRGLEQYGRVVVTLDGARQDYWRVGHGSGSFYVEPELLKEVTVIRGPVSNAYGSGGIGGVVAFETKDAGDFLEPDETWALSEKLGYESNGDGWTTSTTGAYRFTDNLDVIGNFIYRTRDAHEDGAGAQVPWTGEDVISGYGKVTMRPAEGHELKLGAILQRYDDFVTGSSGSQSATLSRYDAKTTNNTYTANYSYKPEDNPYIDFHFDAYHNQTRADQTQVWPANAIGSFRYYDVATTGFNTRNSSRFDAFGLQHTLTYGGDYYYLEGESSAAHFGAGEQQGYGAFLQWQGDYNEWLEVITAVRYDGYQLDGQLEDLSDASLSGSRWSPRVTIGVKPLTGLQVYGTYSEGYRAPGLQDVYRGGGAHGASDTYIPNLFLQPETAKSWEAGLNAKYDDVLIGGDLFRAKLNVFDTHVDDYIDVDLTVTPRTATNIGEASLKGIEAEAVYDWGWGFFNGTASYTKAKMLTGVYAGQTLNNTPLERFSATFGVRALDDRLTMGVQYLSIGEITRTSKTNPSIPGVVDPGFSLTNLFANWSVNENVKLDLGIDNIFNEEYTDPQSSWSTSAATEAGKGRTFKISLTGRIGG